MGNRKGGEFDLPSRERLHVDNRDLFSPNGQAPSTESPPAQIRPRGAKSSKTSMHIVRVRSKFCVLMQNATTDFAAATWRKLSKLLSKIHLVCLHESIRTLHVTLLGSGSTSAGPKSLQSSRPRLLPSKLPRLLPPTCLLLLGLESAPPPAMWLLCVCRRLQPHMHLHFLLHMHQHMAKD